MLNLSVETEELARLVAVKSGRTPEDVVREGVEKQARNMGLAIDRKARRVDMKEIDAITSRCAGRRLLDGRSPREILDEAWGEPA